MILTLSIPGARFTQRVALPPGNRAALALRCAFIVRAFARQRGVSPHAVDWSVSRVSHNANAKEQ